MRVKEIDFLRGAAVMLVLMRHYNLSNFTHKIGWVGVDLFFVLSGFLVSGLLFHEYKKSGKVRPLNFLVRRGFKIYPLFYTLIIVVVLVKVVLNFDLGIPGNGVTRNGVLSEIFFVQNYGTAMLSHTWSLAVEEHFYVLLAVGIFMFSKYKLLDNSVLFSGFCISVFVLCLIGRIITYKLIPYGDQTHMFPTHLRIDSLLWGVFISYNYSFKKERFVNFVQSNKLVLYVFSLCLLSVCAVFSVEDFALNTFGLSALYIGFGILLSLFLVDERIKKLSEMKLVKPAFAIVSVIGFYSYSIYLWHMLVVRGIMLPITSMISTDGLSAWKFFVLYKIYFLIYFSIAVSLGILSSKLIEIPFLKLREKYFPKT